MTGIVHPLTTINWIANFYAFVEINSRSSFISPSIVLDNIDFP